MQTRKELSIWPSYQTTTKTSYESVTLVTEESTATVGNNRQREPTRKKKNHNGNCIVGRFVNKITSWPTDPNTMERCSDR